MSRVACRSRERRRSVCKSLRLSRGLRCHQGTADRVEEAKSFGVLAIVLNVRFGGTCCVRFPSLCGMFTKHSLAISRVVTVDSQAHCQAHEDGISSVERRAA